MWSISTELEIMPLYMNVLLHAFYLCVKRRMVKLMWADIIWNDYNYDAIESKELYLILMLWKSA